MTDEPVKHMSRISLIQADCLSAMKAIPDQSVNMVLCDLPYGTTQNTWDSVIPLDKLWREYERILAPQGAAALTIRHLEALAEMIALGLHHGGEAEG